MKRERGHAMLELAVSAAVMIAFVSATFQFGYTFYVYNQLLSAVGNGGRYAAMRTYGDVDGTNRAIRNMVVYGDSQPVEGAQPAVANLKPEQVDVQWTMNEAGAPAYVRVSIREFTVNAVFKSFTLSGRPSVEFPSVGRVAGSK
jgi:hypothetical protein